MLTNNEFTKLIPKPIDKLSDMWYSIDSKKTDTLTTK